MGCVSSHEEHDPVYNNMTENNINRFKVTTDESLASEGGLGVKSGILEINDDELLLHQKHGETIRWSFKSLRRFGQGSDTFLFESGRRCTTGIGLFAFKCRRADILHNVFAEKLRRFSAINNGGDGTMVRSMVLNSAPTRYSEGVIRSPPLASMGEAETYLTPIPSNPNSYVNGNSVPYGGQMNGNIQTTGQPYMNLNSQQPTAVAALPNDYMNTGESNSTSSNGQVPHTSHPYTNTGPTAAASLLGKNGVSMNGSVSTASVNGSTPTSVNGGTSGPAVRELNYAELDLPKSNAIGFPQTARQNGSAKSSQPTLQNGSAAKASIQYVDIPAYNDDDDDDAFLPPGTPTARPPPYANVTSTAGTGEKQHTLSHSNSHTSYVNIEGAHSQSNGKLEAHRSVTVNGMSQVQYGATGGVRPSLAAEKSLDSSGTQYTTIDFQKTAALASTAKSNQLQSESSQEGLRKTRHDSSADDLMN